VASRAPNRAQSRTRAALAVTLLILPVPGQLLLVRAASHPKVQLPAYVHRGTTTREPIWRSLTGIFADGMTDELITDLPR